MMRLYKTSPLLRWIYPGWIWKKKTNDPVIYLTFDDGPVPGVTEFVLDTLADYSARATFFCVGQNLERYPYLAKRITSEGHRMGNHTHRHLQGRKTHTAAYVADVDACSHQVALYDRPDLFRPPHGRMRWGQSKALKDRYKIIMWDVLAWDFHPDQTAKTCLEKTIRYTGSGSIVFFHDSIKTEEKIRYVLPRYLEYFREKGYVFKVLD